MSSILWSFSIWSKLEKWKSSTSGCLVSWSQIKKKKKNHQFEASSSLILTTTNHFSIGLDCDMWWKVDFIWQLVMTNSMRGSRRHSKALLKAKFVPKKYHGHCLVVCYLSDPLQLSESWRNQYIWEVHSANQWDTPRTVMPAASIGQQKGPNSPQQCLTPHSNASKVEWIGLQSFASSAIFTWPLTNWLPLPQASQQLFAGKTLPQPTAGRKCFPRMCQILKHRFLCYMNKPTYFSLVKMCWL